jgi:F-type H+-transporting ATPase subunit a
VTGLVLAAGENPFITEEFHRPSTKLLVWDCLHDPVRILGVDFCINRVILLLILVVAAYLALFWIAFRKPKIVPGKFQAMMEMGVEFVRNQIVVQMIGPDGMKFFPFLATLFFFIFLGNILEVIPGINFPLNSRLAFPAVLAVVAWVVYN